MPSDLEILAAEAVGCTLCPLSEGRTNVVFGMGNPAADLVFIGEGPGAEEDKQGLPFVGRSGKLLDKLMLEEISFTRDHCYIANVVKCRPPGNRDPKPDEIESCRPYLEKQLELIDPRVIVTLGNFSSKLLLDTTTGITKLRGRTYTYGDALLIPTFHPSAAPRGGGEPTAKMRSDPVRAKPALCPCGAPGHGAAGGGQADGRDAFGPRAGETRSCAMMRARTKSVEETRQLGSAIAELIQPHDVLLLSGDLGAGKTALVQGLGEALGVRDQITSPTFTLAREYEGRLKLNHIDVYRLERIDEVAARGLPELIDDDSVTFVEWGAAIVSTLPAD